MTNPEIVTHTKFCRSMLECDGIIYDGWLTMGCDCSCHDESIHTDAVSIGADVSCCRHGNTSCCREGCHDDES